VKVPNLPEFGRNGGFLIKQTAPIACNAASEVLPRCKCGAEQIFDFWYAGCVSKALRLFV